MSWVSPPLYFKCENYLVNDPYDTRYASISTMFHNVEIIINKSNIN
ncbi:hypothetical protein SBF1_260011 [Candidatus Desulfosporosinus infrequens]|uniref:Uncharacterized protein n=1 Tax=Candidatus Desulfosporosinus infrequens TaxID=2043169 RepID=A0A2U3KR01_9FIRM|nr:hypothetical protein SBF1_260011 [Candidatus Desulfosporosinus infrequens]